MGIRSLFKLNVFLQILEKQPEFRNLFIQWSSTQCDGGAPAPLCDRKRVFEPANSLNTGGESLLR